MKKAEIKKAVEKAKDRNMKKAIASVGQSQAYGEVYDALREPESPAEEAAESPAEENAEMASETVAQAGPKPPSQNGIYIAATPAAAMASVMTRRKY